MNAIYVQVGFDWYADGFEGYTCCRELRRDGAGADAHPYALYSPTNGSWGELRWRYSRPSIDMLCACIHVNRMTSMIQIRNVPTALHRQLKSRAALAGMSLSDYLLGEIRKVAERPTLAELRARLESRSETSPSVSPAQAVRAERDRR